MKKRIHAHIDLRDTSRQDVYDFLMSQDKCLRPTRYKYGEIGKGKELGNASQARSLIKDTGLFPILFNENSNFMFRNPTPVYQLLSCEFKTESRTVEAFFEQLPQLRPRFGCAFLWEEKIAKNRVSVKVNSMGLEAWVGLDYNVYIPGLFWLTLMPRKLLSAHGVVAEELEQIAHNTKFLADDQLLYKFHVEPNLWRSNENVKATTTSSKGIFNKALVERELLGCASYQQFDSIVRKWK